MSPRVANLALRVNVDCDSFSQSGMRSALSSALPRVTLDDTPQLTKQRTGRFQQIGQPFS